MATRSLALQHSLVQDVGDYERSTSTSPSREPFDLPSLVQLGDLAENPIKSRPPLPARSISFISPTLQMQLNNVSEENLMASGPSPSHSPPAGSFFSSDAGKRHLHKYLPLYRAAQNGDWEKALEFFHNVDPDGMTARITSSSETAIHVAIQAGHSTFVENLLKLLPPNIDLAIQAEYGYTVLHQAAIAGMVNIAKQMVSRNPKLTQIRTTAEWTPLVFAVFANSNAREMTEYLLTVTKDDFPSPYAGHLGGNLFTNLIKAEFYDIALSLLHRYPNLAILKDHVDNSALKLLAEMPYVFYSGSQLGLWQRFLYSSLLWDSTDITVDLDAVKGDAWLHLPIKVDMENPVERMGDPSKGRTPKFLFPSHLSHQVFQWLRKLLRNGMKQIVPSFKQVYEKKLMHEQVLNVVKCICRQLLNGTTTDLEEEEEEYAAQIRISDEISDYILESGILKMATTGGIVEIVRECAQTFPEIVLRNLFKQRIFEISIEERHEKIYNLFMYEITDYRKSFALFDDFGNSSLHLAAKLSPASKLISVSCVALQMQRELQWFKEVENNIPSPDFKIWKNNDEKIPRVLFSEEHVGLMEKGEKWMKETADSCMLVATLIATVMFAAAFTVPGGNFSDSNESNKGIPIFLHDKSFMVFAVADVLALFSSSTSVLMFLSILTARYAEEEFLRSLPKRLIIGLATLFFSIVAMMIAFSATLSIALGPRYGWIPIPLAFVASVPATLFAMLQFPLFLEMTYSTYGPSIFGKRKRFMFW